MDAFFTSCEERRNKNLKNKIFVVANRSKSSVVASSNYKARKLGIKSAMPLFKAKQILNNLLIIESDLKYYQTISNQIFVFIKKKYTNKIEVTSIDECYLDVSLIYAKFKNVRGLILNIQKNIFAQFNLTCSIGASFSMFFAKISANINKPNGYFIITEKNYKQIIDHFKIDIVSGIGKSAQLKLLNLNVKTIKDLKLYLQENYNNKNNVFNSKIIAQKLLNEFNGNFNANLNLKHIKKSISVEKTFETNLSNIDLINLQFEKLLKKLFLELNSESFLFKTLKIKLKDVNFNVYSFQSNLKNYSNDFNYVFKKLKSLFKTNWNKNSLRLIGVGFANLKFSFNTFVQEKFLFEEHSKNDLKTKINKKYQAKIIY